MKRSEAGLTLIEILTSLALAGVMMAWLFSATGRLTGFSNNQSAAQSRLQAVQETGSYLTDQIRAALQVPDNASVPDGKGGVITCQRAATRPCLAAVVPVVESDAQAASCGREPGGISGTELISWRYVPRNTLGEFERSRSTALDAQALAMIETRTRLTPMGCAPGTLGDLLGAIASAGAAATTTGVVSDNLTLRAGEAAFEFQAAQRTVHVRLVTISEQRGVILTTPQAGSLRFSARPRNLP